MQVCYPAPLLLRCSQDFGFGDRCPNTDGITAQSALIITAENAEDAEKMMNSAISEFSAVKLSLPVAASPA